MAELGFRTMDEMVGRCDVLKVDEERVAAIPKLQGIDLAKILTPAWSLREDVDQKCTE
eukprot:UC4_evm1s1285